MHFDVFNPYSNQDVTSFYVDVVIDALKHASHSVSRISSLSSVKAAEDRGIVVVSPMDVGRIKRYGYKKVILWVQGLLAEESYMRNKSKSRYIALSCVCKWALQHADLTLMVSEAMADFYRTRHKVRLGRYFVMPCFNVELPSQFDFDPIGRKRGNTFLYAGSLEPWQCFEETVRLYGEIEKHVPDAHLLVLTSEFEKAKNVLEGHGIRRHTIDCVDRSSFGERVQMVKYGFCLREDNPVNNVSTPTKLSSYVANGVIPIYSTAIKDFSRVARQSEFCIPISDFPANNEMLSRIIDSCRKSVRAELLYEDFRKAFGQYYSRNSYIDRLADEIRESGF